MSSFDEKTVQLLADVAHRIRIHSIEATSARNEEPSSCSTIAEIISVLFFHEMKYTVAEPCNPAADRFVLSKGHAAPALYAAWAEAGHILVSELIKLRHLDNLLEGFSTPRLDFIDVATGSLGQGLSVAAGMAYTGKYLEKSDYRVFCLCGDGECAEGSIWEAMAFASFYKLDNLVNIIDVNGLGQSGPTMYQHNIDLYKRRTEAFGFHTQVIDGHNVAELMTALDIVSKVKDQPCCILAKTHKGKYFPDGIDITDSPSWQGKGDKTKTIIESIQARIVTKSDRLAYELLPIKAPSSTLPAADIKDIKLSKPPSYKLGEQVATRLAYGTGLVKLGEANQHIIALDGDVKNSTYSLKFQEAFPDRFIECYIAEQNLAGVAIGCATRDRTVAFASTFGAFWSRAFDQIRMGAISQTNVNFMGSHVGCSIGEDGPSQMALEDLSMFRAIHGSTIFYPSDAVSTERALELAANTKGVCYIRTSQPTTAVIYSNEEEFKVGQAKIVRKSDNDFATIVAAGITLQNAMQAATKLEVLGKNVLIIDVFTVKPLDWQTILANVRKTGNRVLVVEDHYPEGGICDAVANALLTQAPGEKFHFLQLNVKSLPMSGKPEELMELFEIDAKAIHKAVLSF